MIDMLLFDLGLRDYGEVWAFQKQLVLLRSRERVQDSLILVEHPHVITVGRRGKRENVLVQDLPVYEIERGGDVTYHGPGQLVGYPILSLEEHALDIQAYLRSLEEVLIRAVREFGVDAGRGKQTGVWVQDRKLASIGVAIQHWITFHGFALNVNTDLQHFQRIRPCGLEPSVITSMKEVLGFPLDFDAVKHTVKAKFAEVFACQWEPAERLQHNGSEEVAQERPQKPPVSVAHSFLLLA